MSVIQTTPIDVNSFQTTGTSANFGAAIVAGRTIAVGIVVHNATVTTVTDTLGNSYALVRSQTYSGDQLCIYRAFNVAGGTNAVTVNVSGASDFTFAASEIDAVPTTDPNDATNSATATSAAPTVSVTTVDAAPQMFGVFSHIAGFEALNPGSGYTLLAKDERGDTNMPLLWMYQSFGSAGAKTVNGTIATSQTHGIIGASFKTALPPALDQYRFRFRNDDGPEDTATPMAGENVNITLAPDLTFRLRFGINATGNPSSKRKKAQYRNATANGPWRTFDTQG